MVKCGKDILNKRFGSDQNSRFIEALDPQNTRLMDLDLQDWMKFAYDFAKHVNYFDTADDKKPAGNWTAFFETDTALSEVLKKLVDDEAFKDVDPKTITPHLALFISFLKLMEMSRERFNGLLKRHLDFYYADILQIQKLPATPDKVHVIFELAKNSLDAFIQEGSKLDAGKDADGKKRTYKTTENLVANKALVADIKTFYTDHDHQKLKAATVANSYDGAGIKFPDDVKTWWPFGYYQTAESASVKYPELPDAKAGFAIASGLLQLGEGRRILEFNIESDTEFGDVSFNILHDQIEIFMTGENGWLGPYRVTEEVTDAYSEKIYKTELQPDKKQVSLVVELPKDLEAVTTYISDVHQESFNTSLPVCRFIFNTREPEGVNLFRGFVEKKLINLELEVCVEGVTSLHVENDQGNLNVEKPFYPFGINPNKDSNFYIGYEELFNKRWTDLNVDISWKNTPASFRSLYIAYRQTYRYEITPLKFLEFMGTYQQLNIEGTEFVATPQDLVFETNESDLIVEDDSYFKANVEMLTGGEWIQQNDNEVLFSSLADGHGYNFTVDNNPVSDKNGPIRVTLKQSFLHELYPKIYTLALRSEEENVLIPNEPYTPVVDTIELNYTAAESCNFTTSQQGYESNNVRIFHEHPFGQTEEHPWLKQQHEFLGSSGTEIYPVPTACQGGDLYIGLEQIEQQQQVSLLVRVLEGSENPLADSFTGKQHVEWAVLCSDEWKILNSDYLLANQTDNFLKSGIVKIQMPDEATMTNTRLPSGKIWLRAKMHKSFDVVCRIFSITAQAVEAEFEDNDNELSHLENGLEAETISKLKKRLAAIKGVGQPYSSFSGRPRESDDAYYRRISERLRHKSRTVTLWDYEKMILQTFPEIFKVKCLNHTKAGIYGMSYLSPGNVMLVVIPDTEKKNVFDMYQPRVSKATLNAVETYVNQFNTLHVTAKVVNPDYEEVQVNLKVKFKAGFDENFYLKQLNKDIITYMSPWAFKTGSGIEFGVSLHRSHLINFIEKLSYVNYVQDVKLILNGETHYASVAPSGPAAILVSAKKHTLSTDIEACETEPEDKETCQT